MGEEGKVMAQKREKRVVETGDKTRQTREREIKSVKVFFFVSVCMWNEFKFKAGTVK